jgi:hypothetical protein
LTAADGAEAASRGLGRLQTALDALSGQFFTDLNLAGFRVGGHIDASNFDLLLADLHLFSVKAQDTAFGLFRGVA